MSEKKYSPLTQYIYWLKNNQEFPSDANALYLGTLLNLTEDDFQACVYMNSLINEDQLTFYNATPEQFGELHKIVMTKNNPQFIKTTRPNIKTLQAIRSKYPHLQLSDIETYLSTVEDQDVFLDSLGLKDGKIVKTELTLAVLQHMLQESNSAYVLQGTATDIKQTQVLFLGNEDSIDIPYLYTNCVDIDNVNLIISVLPKKAVIVPNTDVAVKRMGIGDDLKTAYKTIYRYENIVVVPSTVQDKDRLCLVQDIIEGTFVPRIKKENKKILTDAEKMCAVVEPIQQELPFEAKPVVITDKQLQDNLDSIMLDSKTESSIETFIENLDKPKTKKVTKKKEEPKQEEQTGLMLVDTVYEADKEAGDTAYHIFRQGPKKIIQPINTSVTMYAYNGDGSLDNKKSVVSINNLTSHTIPYYSRWNFMKENPVTYAADLSFAVHKNVEWRATNKEAIYKLRVGYIDIELYTGDDMIDFGKLETEATKFPINLITIYDNYTNKSSTFVYNLNKVKIDLDKIKKQFSYDLKDFEVLLYNTEREMLEAFLNKFDELEMDLCSGWNTEQFDIPYIYYRCKALGVDLSWKYSQLTRNNVTYVDVNIPFVFNVDYLRLYKEMSFGERESFRLGFIANYELGIDKLELEDDMTSVFNKDIEKFIAYNINDVYLVKMLDDKLKYIDLLYGIVQITNVGWKEGYTTLRLMDGLIYTHLYSKGLTFITRSEDQTKETLLGAYVRTPNKGLYEWVCDLDLASLYPYITARYNLSPDTYIGKIDEDVMYQYLYHRDKFLETTDLMVSLSDGRIIKTTTEKFVNWIAKQKYIVTIAGTIFKSHEEELSVLYEIVDMMIQERSKYKKQMFDAIQDKNEMLVDRYNNMQTTYKVLTNSLYGAMANAGFRFFSNEVAQTITKTGREISKLGSYMVNLYLHKMENEKNINADFIDLDPNFLEKAEEVLDTVIYGDSVVGSTSICVNNKQTTMEELWYNLNTKPTKHSTKERIYFEEPTYIHTVDSKNKSKQVAMEYIMRHKTDKNLYKIKTSSGKELIVTEDESIMVMQDGQLMECKPTQLKSGMEVLTGGTN